MAPGTNDTTFIGNTAKAGGFTVTEDATLAIASLTMAGSLKGGGAANTTLLLTQPAILTVNERLSFGSNSIISGAGSLIANGK